MLAAVGRESHGSFSQARTRPAASSTSPRTLSPMPARATATTGEDVTPAAEHITAVVADASPAGGNTPEFWVENKAAAIMREIDQFHYTNPADLRYVSRVDPAVWAEIIAHYEDSVKYRLEYLANSKEMIVTWPSWLHETFDVTLGSFNKIAEVSHTPYRCLLNKDFRVNTGAADASRLIPDFALVRQDTPDPTWKNLIVLESAASQTKKDLDNKVGLWLKDPNVQLVIAVDLQISKYHAPKRALDTEHPPTLTLKEVHALAAPRFGPITINGHVWAPMIEKITVGLHSRDDGDVGKVSMFYDLTPVFPGNATAAEALLANKDRLTEIIGNVFWEIVGSDLMKKCFSKDAPFSLKWDAFIDSLPAALRNDAHYRFQDHYKQLPPAVIPTTSVSALRLALKRAPERDEEREGLFEAKKPRV
ncbi:hypothetical protein FB451DRAFT_117736 [Mycena latifolia]|nr:hypothetical protein FB451DRAFT_117736 [Mycena latifolia]